MKTTNIWDDSTWSDPVYFDQVGFDQDVSISGRQQFPSPDERGRRSRTDTVGSCSGTKMIRYIFLQLIANCTGPQVWN